MRNRDYTQEISLAPSTSRVPLPVTIVVWVGMILGGAMFVRHVVSYRVGAELPNPAPSTDVASNH